MEDKTKNLCAQIPESLHARVREAQEKSGQTLSQYITAVLISYYEKKEGNNTMDNTRTVAFQIPEELFQELKKYLKKHDTITVREVEQQIAGVTVRQFWSRKRLTVQDPAKVSGQVIDFLLDQQYIQPAGGGRYKRKP